MHTCFLKETKIFHKLKLFLFFYFGIKKGLNSLWIHQNDLHIFYMPILKKEKNCEKMLNYLKQCGIKKVCISSVKDEMLIKKIKEHFKIIKGAYIFFDYFEKIMDKYMKMHSFLYEESEIVFISDEPEKVKKYLEKIIKKFKKISIYTMQKQKFSKLTEDILKKYGITVFLKDETIKPKKYQKIYVNLDEKQIFHSHFLKNVFLIDIFRKYENAYQEVLFKIPIKEESLLKEHKILKNLCFLEYMTEESKESLQKEYKIVNIKKI